MASRSRVPEARAIQDDLCPLTNRPQEWLDRCEAHRVLIVPIECHIEAVFRRLADDAILKELDEPNTALMATRGPALVGWRLAGSVRAPARCKRREDDLVAERAVAIMRSCDRGAKAHLSSRVEPREAAHSVGKVGML